MISAFPRDDMVAHLLRESTRLKDGGDMDAALACLAEVQPRMLVSEVSYPIETWCKYPRYLMSAGQFDRAQTELQWLLDDLPRRRSKEFFVDDLSVGGSRSKKLRASQAFMKHPITVIQKLMERVAAARTKAGLVDTGTQ